MPSRWRVGIGVSTVLFALVDAVVLRPLPYPDAERLVRIVDTNAAAGIDRAGAASGNLHDWRQRTSAFAGIAGYYAMGRTLSTDRDAEVVISAQVTADFFPLPASRRSLDAASPTTRWPRPASATPRCPRRANPVAVIGHGLWQSRFAADPAVVGRTIMLERRPFTVVGVMPEGFALPDRGVQVWLPWQVSAESPRDQHYLGAIGRLAPGVTIDDAERQLARVAAELAALYPATNQGWSARLLPLREDTVATAAGALWMLLGAVGLLLLVACANVALLTLMRGLDRAGDTAVRLALGASAARLVREFLMESVLLALAGGGLGVMLALAAVRLLPTVAPDLPRVEEVSLDLRALLFVAGVTTISALLSGLPQAWRRAHLAPASALAETAQRTTAGGRHLLRDGDGGGAGRDGRGAARRIGTARPQRAGAAARPILGSIRAACWLRRCSSTARPTAAASARAPTTARCSTAWRRCRASSPSAARRPCRPARWGPTSNGRSGPRARTRRRPSVRRRRCGWSPPGYFSALGLRLADGRAIDDRDAPSAPRVVMVNESLARRLWPGQSAVGRQLVVDYSTAGTFPYEIVGVVGDMRFKGPRSAPGPEIYLPHAQRPYLILNVVVKASGDPRALMPAVQAALREIDPQKPAQGLYLLEDLVGATYARDRQVMATLLVFAGAATFLAVLSVYGVLSQRVRERTREIGIRMAMGADARGLVGWVARVGLRLIAIGLVTGLAAAWLASSAVERLLFGVTPTDALTAAAVLAAVGTVGLVATLVPSWRATRIDPVAILRRG